jgi:imidazolonepropionase-like amidohydrolase
MNEAGIPIIECLQAATIVNANILSMETEIGQIEKDFIADIVATKSNPEDDISTLENIVFVMKEGVIYKN